MTTRNQCQFWDCNETTRRRDHILCPSHYTRYEANAIDQCASCRRYKDAKDDACLDCYRQTAGAWAPSRHNATNGGRRASQSGKTASNECRFWSCSDKIPNGHYLCLYHFIQARQQRIDECQKCQIYKAVRFSQCYNCHQGTEGESKIQRSNEVIAEIEANHTTTEFFVDVLTLDIGAYYIGHTNDLHARLQEHRTNMTHSTKGTNPKCVWFTTVPTRSEAENLENELNRLNDSDITRREIHRMVVKFRQLVEELDHAPHQSTAHSIIQERRLPYGGVAPPTSHRHR